MPTISARGATAYTSPIRRLSPFADAARLKGRKVLHLNIGQPDIFTPQSAIQKLQHTPIEIVAYSPSKGLLSYREKLLTYYATYDIELTADDVFITNGASEGIFFAFFACLDRGQTVLSTEPMYANYVGFSELADVCIKPISTTIETGFDLPTIDAFRAACTPDVKAIMLCNPNNPTGAVYSESMLRALAALIKEKNLFLFVDEVYREFIYGDIPFFSALHLQGLEENVVVFDSISKRYSACGARVGAVVSRNPEIQATILKYAETRLSPPLFGQMLGEALVDVPPTYFEAVKNEYRKRRDLLFARLHSMEGVTCYLPEGAFYVFAKLPIDDSDRFCQWLLEEFSYQNQTVMLAPGKGFYATRGLGTQEVRIAYVLNEKDLNAAMDCLEQALVAYVDVMAK